MEFINIILKTYSVLNATIGVVGFISAIVIPIYLFNGITKKCPNCKKWGTRKDESKVLNDSDIRTKTVTRFDIHKNSEGKEIGRTERKEQVKVKYSNITYNYYCSICNHKWSKNVMEEKVL